MSCPISCTCAWFKNMKSGHLLVLILSTIFFFVAITGGWGLFVTRSGPLSADKQVIIPRGASVAQIASVLKAEGVIEHKNLFKLTSKMMFSQKLLQAGGYLFPAHISMRDTIKMMERGDVQKYNVTFPEGLTTAEMLEKLKESSYLIGDVDVASVAEGTLLPETYQYTYGEKRSDVVARMQQAMTQALDEAWQSRKDDLPLKNKEELLILASIVEKETSLQAEQAEVAGVFINRLNKKMRLQSDPTVIYGLSDYNGDIRSTHLKEPHPYNTYVIPALPIGAISNPGKNALMAVAKANDTENLYFVADLESGGHIFASTLAQHNKNVQMYLKAYKKKHTKAKNTQQ